MIDNYDSFTYNLVQYLGELGEEVRVYRNDEIDARRDRAPRARAHLHLARALLAERGRHFVGRLRALRRTHADPRRVPRPPGDRPGLRRPVVHAQTADARQDLADPHTGVGVFSGLPSPFEATRYHSLAVERASLPDCLEVTAWTDDGEIMGAAAPVAAGRGRAVPSRVDPDRARPRDAEELPAASRDGAAADTCAMRPSLARHRERASGSAMTMPTLREETPWRSPQRSAGPVHRAPRDLPRRDAVAVAPAHERRTVAGADRRADDGSARQEGDDRRDRRRGAGHARVRDQVEPADRSNLRRPRAAPAATARTPSTSRPRRCSSPRPPARASPSTAAAACRRDRAAPTCWRRSAPTSC